MQIFRIAIIDESQCIGCTKCLQICPFDAIIGANKQLHTVIKNECTGCGLCVPPCPVDCIQLQAVAEQPFDRTHIKARRHARRQRLQQHGIHDQKMEIHRENFAAVPESKQDLKIELNAALIRARQKRQQGKPT